MEGIGGNKRKAKGGNKASQTKASNSRNKQGKKGVNSNAGVDDDDDGKTINRLELPSTQQKSHQVGMEGIEGNKTLASNPVPDGEPHCKKRKAKGGNNCLLYTSPSPRDRQKSRMPSSA